MNITPTHRERRREDGSLSIDSVILLGEVEYILERNCATRRIAQHLADEEVRLIRRLVLARLRQLHLDHSVIGGHKPSSPPPPKPEPEITLISPVPSGTKPNGQLPTVRKDKVSAADL